MPNNADLIRRWFEEVWNQGREATIDELCSKQAVGHGQTHDGSDIIGPAHFKQFWHAFRSGFSSIHVEIHQTIEQGEMVLARWTLNADHTGPFMGIEPSRSRITTNGMSLQRFVGGQIVEAWDNWDQLGAFTQLGAVSFKAEAPAA
jgi:predicted ester cyclase